MNSISLPEVTLVVFACEGREHLLRDTLTSFNKCMPYHFSSCILAIDGTYDLSNLTNHNFDFLIQNIERKGYVRSIINALNCIETEFFFWLEEDWLFSEKINLYEFMPLLQSNPKWVQIRLSKTAPLTVDEKAFNLGEGVFKSIYGFSANPCLCRTTLIRQGFYELQQTSRDVSLGFEEFLSQCYQSQNMACVVVDPGESRAISHSGYLESTPRQWHMTTSLDGTTNDDYLSGMRGSPPPPLWRKLLMVFRLLRVFLRISTKQFWSRAAYDLAFRFVASSEEIIG